MVILFSPSEGKSDFIDSDKINENSFIFKELYNERMEVISYYNDYINNASFEELTAVFGIKNEDEIKDLKNNVLELQTCSAINRYDGVAYSYLDYNSIDNSGKEYVLNNTIIFSNLFGPIKAKDKIPFYKLKQGAKLGNFNIEKFYKTKFSNALDEYLKDEDIIDLRAGFYEKFYTVKYPYYTYKFLKNGKTVSHFAKAYRGKLLRIAAENLVKTNDELLNVLPNNLKLVDQVVSKNKTEYVLDILD